MVGHGRHAALVQRLGNLVCLASRRRVDDPRSSQIADPGHDRFHIGGGAFDPFDAQPDVGTVEAAANDRGCRHAQASDDLGPDW